MTNTMFDSSCNCHITPMHWKTLDQNCRGENSGKCVYGYWTAKYYFIRCCSTTVYLTHIVYKWYNVRVPRKVHDVGSFLGATDGHAAVESCNVCMIMLCRSLQVSESEESEQIQMSGLRCSSPVSTALLVCEVLSRTDNCDGPMLLFVSHSSWAERHNCSSEVFDGESCVTMAVTSLNVRLMSATGRRGQRH